MKNSLKVFENIGELLTLQGAAKKGGRRITDEDLSIIKDAVLVASGGKIVWLDERSKFNRSVIEPFGGDKNAEFISAGGRTVVPGFVECHTHTVFAGDRSEEFEWRIQGESYQEIAARGGGILSTVKATRAASASDLQVLAQERTDRFATQGVTTLEVKSGYGLDFGTEQKILTVAAKLNGPRIVRTYLGPHSRSPDYPDLNAYMEQILAHDLPRIAREKLADRVDIYIEKGFFDLALGRAFFSKAKELGLPISAHVEQLSNFGGTELALQFQPQSVDHVVFVNAETIAKLASVETTAVLLPASDMYLKMRYPPARELLDAGVRCALSTDYNPGTSPTQDLSLIGVLARVEMKMKLAEVFSAFTMGAAHALGLADHVGSLSQGKSCDFSMLDCGWREMFYSVGRHPLHSVYRAGEKL